MTIDEQLRELARHADQHQRVITAAEVVQRVSAQDRPALAAPARLDEASPADPGHREGDIVRLDTEDRPTGTGSVAPRHLSPGRRLLVAAAVAVVAVVGTLLVVAGGEDEEPVSTVTSSSTTTTAPARDVTQVDGGYGDPSGRLVPGRYFIDPDGDDTTPLRVTYQVAAQGWSTWPGAIKLRGDQGSSPTVLSVTTITNLVGDGCLDHTPLDPPVGPTVDDLAIALSQLTPFEVTAPPRDVTLLGYQGKHLELTVPDSGTAGCLDGELHSWFSPVYGPDPFQAYNDGVPGGATEEFWILDVEGTRLVLVKQDFPQTSAEDIAERDAIFDSIRIEP